MKLDVNEMPSLKYGVSDMFVYEMPVHEIWWLSKCLALKFGA